MGKLYTVPVHFTCFFLSVFGIMVGIRWWQSKKLKSDLLNEAIISGIALLSFHMGIYHGNIFFWRLTKIEYAEQFNFSIQENLYNHPYRRMLEYMACVGFYLTFGLIKIKGDLHYYILIPVLVGITGRTIWAYRSDFLKIFSFHTRKVSKIDIFLTDQLCSQVPGLRKVLYIACFFLTLRFMKGDYEFHKTSTVYYCLSCVVSSLPFVWRGFQCFWKFNEEDRSEKSHDLINMGKYVFAMLEALARVAYEKDKTVTWLCLLVVISIAATVYQLYWDFVQDWGLFQDNPDNRWLRSELQVHKNYYYLAVVFNFILRFGWTLTFLFSRYKVNDENSTFFVAVVEVFRRGMWNFFRMENEEAQERTRASSSSSTVTGEGEMGERRDIDQSDQV